MTVTLEQFLFVFGLTLFAGLSTGIGGFIAFFTGKDSDSGTFLSASLGFSAGVMVYISLVELMAQARNGLAAGYGQLGGGLFALGAFAFGILVTFIIDKMIPEVENPHHVRSNHEVEHAEHAEQNERAKFGRAGMLFALAIGIHNFPEGLATFAAGLSGTVRSPLPLPFITFLKESPSRFRFFMPRAAGKRHCFTPCFPGLPSLRGH